MADSSKKNPEQDPVRPQDAHAEEIKNEDFQFVLKALLAAYQPILEQELKRAADPAKLSKEAEAGPPDCDDEMDHANRIFGKFLTEDVALRMLPAEARKNLGPPEQWRWCLRHIQCCVIFGWLVCRGPRHFRAFSYYLHRYWLCVRQTLGRPVSTPPTPQERQDFQILVEELAAAFKPHLTDQLATVEFPGAIHEEVIEGKIDCHEGLEDDEILERLLTPKAAEALLGRESFATAGNEASFWYCRCWCLCGIYFGCCLARSRSLKDLVWCLINLFRCLRRCFGPLTCSLTDPNNCVSEEAAPALGAFVVPIKGTASGAGFTHYVLEWSIDSITFNTSDFFYPPLPPGNAGPGNSPVFNGVLADFDTTFKDPGLYFIRMTVFAAGGATRVCQTRFQLFKKDVRILGVDDYFTLDTGWTDPKAKFVETVPKLCSRPEIKSSEVSFGGSLSVQGGAWVGGCNNGKIKSYTLEYKAGLEINCNSGGWTKFWEVDYATPAQYRFINMRTGTSTLTADWVADCFKPSFVNLCTPFPPPFITSVPNALLAPSSWNSNIGGCNLNGLYTFRLLVTDTNGNTYCDTQRLWIDNKFPCAA
ncbi:MAG TPA: hypothetical protein VG649_21390, partial [Candidatus Angelobacter sp.]|nr:hypothetical protein [Candidatus Angelobacter sp.]